MNIVNRCNNVIYEYDYRLGFSSKPLRDSPPLQKYSKKSAAFHIAQIPSPSGPIGCCRGTKHNKSAGIGGKCGSGAQEMA
jgi:hypothetical protein